MGEDEVVDYVDERGRRYRTGEELGRGVLTAVYSAVATSEGEGGAALALKTVLPLWTGHPLAEARIAREREVAASLEAPAGAGERPACVPILAGGRQVIPPEAGVGAGAAPGRTRPFHVSPRLSGCTLAERLRTSPERDEPRFFAEALGWIDELLGALAHLHQAGWVHRDLKPQNVFIGAPAGRADERARAWLIDFGLALRIGAPRRDGDDAFGTPAYVSPEVIAGAPVDPRADLYSLGLILFELFGGQRPFSGRDPVALLDAHLSETPPRLRDLRPARSDTLDRVIAATLGKDPADRPSSATELRARLRDVPEATTPKERCVPSPTA